MAFGISIYPGLDNTMDENIALIRRAAKSGFSMLFTSLHIPEHDNASFAEDLRPILGAAREAQLDLVADVTPKSAELLGLENCTPEAFAAFGVHTLRLDDGFDAAKIAAFSRSGAGAHIQLNASTLTEEFLAELSQRGTDFAKLNALHNFYPHMGTGLSVRALSEKTALLHRFGVRIGAFVATQNGRKRSPLCDGLPTLELHRNVSVNLAARHLFALGIDDVYLSDSLPTDEELSLLTAATPGCVTLRAIPAIENIAVQRLLDETFTARPDEARDVVRAVEGRALTKRISCPLLPENAVDRPFGAVTLDNENYLRYAGELQIAKRSMPADPRTNVIAHIRPEERFLIPCIRPGCKFRIKLDNL